jgi:RNA polymerase sigma-70 factor, ECF subfamily
MGRETEAATVFSAKSGETPAALEAGMPELLVRAQSGDNRAFESLMQVHQRQVLGTALRMLGNSEDARDAAQEVFLKLYKYLRSLDPGRPLAPWLYRVTINVCNDLRRQKLDRNFRSFDLSHSMEAHDERFPGAEEKMISDQERDRLQTALNRLPEKERTAIILRDVSGMDTAEVSRILGTSEVTVRSQICRARIRLRKYLSVLREKPL